MQLAGVVKADAKKARLRQPAQNIKIKSRTFFMDASFCNQNPTAKSDPYIGVRVMKKLLLAAAAVVGAIAFVPVTGAMAPAAAQGSFSFSFDTGDVHMAYRDGYYDRYNRWHAWRSAREAREFRSRYASRYRDSDRDGIPNRYDRDRDNDGIPNRYDRNPNRPNYRNDRDGDGVPNRFDRFPNNPRRN